MIDPEEKLLAAAQKARADHETAREIAARLLAPPDPVDILAGVIADRGDVADERDELRAERDAMTADLDEIHGMVGRPAVTVVEAVALGLSEYAPSFAVRESTSEASAIAKTQRTAADNLRAALDRVATAAGFGPGGAAPDVADRVIAVIRAMQARPAALPADLRTYLETLLNRLQGTDGLAVAAETAALKRWIALPTAEVTP